MGAQTSILKPLVIIPAAGFGRRVGAPNSKEILKLAGSDEPLIERAFRECEGRDWPIHLITRPEKTDLLAYCQQRAPKNLSLQLVGPTQEWPATVLLSEPYWQEWNLLFLPDLIFEPSHVLDQMLVFAKDEISLIAAGLETEAPGLWGCLRVEGDGFSICEKPKDLKEAWAWGFLLFKKSFGKPLFESLLAPAGNDPSDSGAEIKRWHKFTETCKTLDLLEMKDLTR